MITLINKDNYIFDLEYRSIDIVAEYQTTGKINISTNYEGICLHAIGFYSLLDYICEKFNIDKSKITIYTSNILEKHPEYTIVTIANHFIGNMLEMLPKGYTATKQDKLKTIGCFVGLPSWSRLILTSWLYENYKNQSLVSLNYDRDTIPSADLDNLNFNAPNDLVTASKFLLLAPLTIDNQYSRTKPRTELYIGLFNLLNYYDQFFSEIVLETYITGETFFPTEKTARPIIGKTPMIVMGPRNFLNNLRKLGFRTFDRWWSEDYDNYEGVNRVDRIKEIVTEIMTWSQPKMHSVLQEMQEVLTYNYEHYINYHDKK